MPVLAVHRSLIAGRRILSAVCRWLLVGSIVQGLAATSMAVDFMAGGDISALTSLEQAGAHYSVDGVPMDPVQIFTDHGMNWARLRLFVNPSGEEVQDNDLAYTINLAQRVKAAGMNVLLDFHYSDTWADPGKQFKPAAWQGLSFPQLEQQVRTYTRDVIQSFDQAGVLPEMVQIGNEISSGMIWPDGRTPNWDNLADLISAGINGVHDAVPNPAESPLLMIHHDKGSVWSATSGFFNNLMPRLATNGTDFDVIGYSYYPIYSSHSGGIAGLRQNLNNTVATFDKPVVLVEAGFPSRNPQGSDAPLEFPVSEAGQHAFLEAVVDAVKDVPNDMGRGVFWWYPEATQAGVSGVPIWEGGRNGLFDPNGDLLSTIDALTGVIPDPDPDPSGPYYREDFPSVGTLPAIGWGDSNIGAANDVGVATSATDGYLWWWNNTGLAAATTTTAAVVTNEFGPVSSSAPGLTFEWEQRLEFQFNDSFQNVSGTPVAVRLAVQIDGQWYATADVYATTATGVSGTGPWDAHSMAFDPTASEWRILTLNGSNAQLGAAAVGDLVGDLTGIGFVATFSQFQTLNFNFVEFTMVELPGDYNDNGVVDAADYTVWRDSLGSDNILPNDLTPGDVDQSDYHEWKNNFGTALAGAGSSSGGNLENVPEPTSLAFVLILTALALGRGGSQRWRRRNTT